MTDHAPTARNGDHPDEPADTWEPVPLHELDPRERPTPTIGGFGLIYPGERHTFTGPPESAKTLAAYAIAIEILQEGGTVCVIDFEMGRYQAAARLIEMGCTTDELARIIYVDPAEPATETRVARLVSLAPALVIIDAAAGAFDQQGLDDNKRLDVERFAAAYINPFRRAGIATILLDHVVKNAENRQGWGIGSERKKGVTDIHLGFETITPISRGHSGTYKITNYKDRYGFHQRGKIGELHLASDPETHAISWEWVRTEHVEAGQPFRPTTLMEKVSQYLERQSEPVTRRTILNDVEGTDQYVNHAISRLVEEGYATQEDGPRGAKLVTHLKTFSGQEPPMRTSAEPMRADVQRPMRVLHSTAEVEVDSQGSTYAADAEVDVWDENVQKLMDDKDIPW